MRARLVAAFVAIVILPLVGAATFVALRVPDVTDARTRDAVVSARATVQARAQTACQRAVNAATSIAHAGTATPSAAVRKATASDNSSGADVALLLDDKGKVVSAAPANPSDASDADVPWSAYATAGDCRDQDGIADAVAIVARVPFTRNVEVVKAGSKVQIHQKATAVAAFPWVGTTSRPGLIAGIVQGTDAHVTLFKTGAPAGSAVGNTSADLQRQLATRFGAGTTPAGAVRVGGHLAASLPLLDGAVLVVSEPVVSQTSLYLGLVVIVAAGLVLALLLGALIARRTRRSISDLSATARRIIEGAPRTPELAATPGRETHASELDELGSVLTQLSQLVHATSTDLQNSRDELRRGIGRLGSTLSGTHDLDRILAVILETAMSSVGAQAGALLLTAASRDALYLAVGHGLEGRVDGSPDNRRIALHPMANGSEDEQSTASDEAVTTPRGVVTRVATSGETVFGVVGDHGLVLADDEPRGRTILAVPLRSADRVTGVLALYDRGDGRPFDVHDMQVVRDFVTQATVAIDNVLLHREAQRLSVTDGMTGLWNYRYATLALDREVERAQRFGHPLALLMLDLDRFKRVNDLYGHQRGDAVLIELAARMRTVVREVDIVARYGGEEILLILPETDLAGAELLADRVLDSIRRQPVGGPGEPPVWMTTSIGVSVMPMHGDTARTLLRAADNALYVAKASGRDTVRVASIRRDVDEWETAQDPSGSVGR
ncbi:MAG TPA: sensor domain-containing diguanylate cyclase [Mycobacteriales bacterium]|nr:sensor domain-containing diguanylate cyclase [Mycobacteriales bacterium]